MLPLWLFWHFISSFQDHHSLFHTYNLSHSFPLGICITATMNVVLVTKTPWMADDTASFLYVICAFLEPHFFLEPSQRKLQNHQQSQMCNWSLPLSRSRSLSQSLVLPPTPPLLTPLLGIFFFLYPLISNLLSLTPAQTSPFNWGSDLFFPGCFQCLGFTELSLTFCLSRAFLLLLLLLLLILVLFLGKFDTKSHTITPSHPALTLASNLLFYCFLSVWITGTPKSNSGVSGISGLCASTPYFRWC